uniref:Reverse transcriptase domain-containing protein n=1 Tax=Tanacetum cinerariifolium TaxID=118510 RepID=A0A6L2NJG7_TANCI|nr:hypothetical protein [Tanacetum cinerariifolium]
MPKVLLIAWERFSKIKHAFTDKQYQPEEIQELMCKLLEDVRDINAELSFTNSLSWDRPMIVDDEEHSTQFRLYLENSSKAIAPVLPTEEPEYSLSIGNGHLDTIPATKSDELIKSSVENLVLIPSDYGVISDNESKCDVPVNNESSLNFMTLSNPLFDCNDDFTFSDDELLSNEDVPMENFKIYSNPLFDDEEIISTKIDPHYFNVESNLIESLLNRDTLTDSSPKFDYLLKLAHIHPIPPRIEEANFDLEEEICLVENLSIVSNDPIPISKNKSSNFDHYDEPLFPRPPLEPPDVEVFFDFEPDSGELISTVMNNIDDLIEDECFDPRGGEIDVFANVEDNDYFPFIFVIQIFLPYLIYPEVSPLLLLTGSEDTIFDLEIST